MNRIDAKFTQLKRENRKALIVFITAGYPDLKTTEKLIFEIEDKGGDIIEIGIPFSDPLADGPTIQFSSQEALKTGVNFKKIFALIKNVRKKNQIPLTLMSYFNPINKYGLENFARDSRKAGTDGMIIPDLIPEEASPWLKVTKKNNLDTIFLAAPTTPPLRIRKVASVCSGFLYYVSVTGITGARKKLPEDLVKSLKKVRKIVKKPFACGFGISNPIQAKEVALYSDGIIIGSAIIDIIKKYKSREEMLRKVGKFILKIRKKMDSSG